MKRGGRLLAGFSREDGAVLRTDHCVRKTGTAGFHHADPDAPLRWEEGEVDVAPTEGSAIPESPVVGENVAAILRDVDVVLGGVSLDVIEVVLARGLSALPSGEQLLDERVVRCPGRDRHQEKDSEEFSHRVTSGIAIQRTQPLRTRSYALHHGPKGSAVGSTCGG